MIHAVKRRVIVINMLIVKEHFCVASTIVLEDQGIWTAAQVDKLIEMDYLWNIYVSTKSIVLNGKCKYSIFWIFLSHIEI